MTDQRPSEFAALAEGEALSAYLSGDLDPGATESLEARLREDPELSARLERMRQMLESLRRVEDVSPPHGYAGRLRDALEAARAHGATTAAGAPAEAGGGEQEVRSIASAPSRRRAAWAALGTVAAGLIALAVVGPNVLRFAGSASEDAAEGGAAPIEAAQDTMDFAGEATEESAPADDGAMAEDLGDAGETEAQAAPAEEAEVSRASQPPVIVDEGAALADEAALTEHFSGLPEALELLGTDLAAAEDLAAAYRVALQREHTFASGAQPADCVEPLTADAGAPLVLARAESLTYDGAPALAYLLVGAASESQSLDRVELWVVDPDSCRTRVFLDLTP
ncbi:MAG TPA: hypothetical protein VML96_05540 [Egibacteraceae bacterium]|nr:hypothetical protein [Egibacteraceae bacterium]